MKKILLIMLVLSMTLACGCGEGIETEAPLTDTYADTETESPESETAAPETEAEPPETEAPAETGPVFQKPEISAELKTQYYGYMKSSWKEKIDEIKQKQDGKFTFLLQTDVHMWVGSDTYAANNAKALSHFVDLEFIASPGDLIRGYAYAEDNRGDTYDSLEELVRRYTENVNCPVLMTFGNHDTNAMWCKEHGTATNQINQHDHYFMVTEKLKALNGANMGVEPYCNYYYMDFPEDNIRVIMLNTTDGDYLNEFDKLSTIREHQQQWFRDVALKTDKSVIVMAHIPLTKEFPENGNAPAEGANIMAAVEDFVANGGDFIAYMYGHVHIQADMVDENGRLHISFRNGGNQGEVVMINTEERTIQTIGLGSSTDRSFTYGK